MTNLYRKRRIIVVFVMIMMMYASIVVNSPNIDTQKENTDKKQEITNTTLAKDILNKLSVKGRAPKTDYSREKFGQDWSNVDGCDMRNLILNRDMDNVISDDKCNVIKGVLNDPYTGKTIDFQRGSNSSKMVQIDHVVSLSDAWQKGAQLLSQEKRIELANDPLELLAVDGDANQQKGGGDAATWLPSNKLFRCQYVARQIAVKQKYSLWITKAEFDAMDRILEKCPNETLPTP